MKKRILTFLSVSAVMLTLLVAGTLSANAAFVGDVDPNDAGITAGDARLVLRASVGLETFTEEQTKIADTDGNGAITAADARFILRASVGLEEKLHYMESEITLQPTCTDKGILVKTCTECDDVTESEIDALGHSFAEPEILVAVTCEANGKEKYTCTRKGCTHTEEKTVPAGHTPDIPAATCTEAQNCTRGNHVMTAALGHTTDWNVCSRCKVFITKKYEAQAATIKAKFNEAKTAFDAAYAINSYNSMLDGISWKVLPNTKTAKPYYETAKLACEAALAACGDIPEFAEIKALLAKNITNLTVSIEEANKIITFCNGNPGAIDAVNYDTMLQKLETYNAGFWNTDYKDHTVGNNKKLEKAINW